MIISDFLHGDSSSIPVVARPDTDPLVESDALLEAQILSLTVRGDVGRCAVIIDLRTALHIRGLHAALIVADDLHAARWEVEPIPVRTVWNVVASEVSRVGDSARFAAWTHPAGQVTVTARRLAYYGLVVDDLPEAPADLTSDSEEVIRAGFPQWDSEAHIVAASFLT